MSELVSIARDGAPRAREALEGCVRAGGVALFPADTVYGLGCDPLDGAAVKRIHALKGRDEGKPSAILYFSLLAARELVSALGPRVREALGMLLPGPVTVIVDNPDRRYPLASRDHPERLGVRVIEGPLSGVMTPLFQTSANVSGAPAASRFVEVDARIRERVDLAIDGGELGGVDSTVVDLTALDSSGGWRVLREGAVSISELESRLRGV